MNHTIISHCPTPNPGSYKLFILPAPEMICLCHTELHATLKEWACRYLELPSVPTRRVLFRRPKQYKANEYTEQLEKKGSKKLSGIIPFDQLSFRFTLDKGRGFARNAQAKPQERHSVAGHHLKMLDLFPKSAVPLNAPASLLPFDCSSFS